MTNSFLVAIWVLWGTNQMDTFLSPSGDEILRSTITMQHHVYTLPGQAAVTNSVAILTNSVHLQMKWVEVAAPASSQLPPVPDYIKPTFGAPPPPRTQIKP